MVTGHGPQWAVPVERPEEVADHHGQTPASLGPAQGVDSGEQVAAHTVVRAGGGGNGLERAQSVRPATAGRNSHHLIAGAHHRAQPVASAQSEVSDGRAGRHRQITFGGVDRAEIQTRRHVDDEPGLELAIGHHLPDVSMGCPGRHRPIHPAHVVAGLVLASLPRLGPRSRDEPEVFTLQHPVELAANHDFQGLECCGQLGVFEGAGAERRERAVIRHSATGCPAPGWPARQQVWSEDRAPASTPAGLAVATAAAGPVHPRWAGWTAAAR